MEACAYAALGATYRLVQKYDKALGYHTQELEVYQELGNASGECKAHGHLAAVYMALGKYAMAFKSYEEQLELGQKLKDPVVEAQVYGNMGITKMNVGVMEEAIGYLEQQLATLQQLSGNEALMDRGRAYGNLGDCYEALGDFEEAIKYYDQYLSVAQSLNRMQDQEKAYRGLGNGHRFVSLQYFQKKLLGFFEVFQTRRDCVEWVIPIIALILFCILFRSHITAVVGHLAGEQGCDMKLQLAVSAAARWPRLICMQSSFATRRSENSGERARLQAASLASRVFSKF